MHSTACRLGLLQELERRPARRWAGCSLQPMAGRRGACQSGAWASAQPSGKLPCSTLYSSQPWIPSGSQQARALLQQLLFHLPAEKSNGQKLSRQGKLGMLMHRVCRRQRRCWQGPWLGVLAGRSGTRPRAAPQLVLGSTCAGNFLLCRPGRGPVIIDRQAGEWGLEQQQCMHAGREAPPRQGMGMQSQRWRARAAIICPAGDPSLVRMSLA